MNRIHHTYGHNDSWRVLPHGNKRWMRRAPSRWASSGRFSRGGGKTDGGVLHLAARHKDGKWLMAYLADKTAFSMDLNKLAGADRAAASWIDPGTGRQTPIGSFPASGARNFATPEGWEDALLIVEPVEE